MKNSNLYCMNCGFVDNHKTINKTKTYEINGEKITCQIKVKICSICEEELSGNGVIDEELKFFREEYKRKKNLLTSDEIKEIRSKLEMTQKEFANYLGFGEKTITRYELGQIQEVANDNLMRLALSPDAINMVLEHRELSESTERKLKYYHKIKFKFMKNNNGAWNKQNNRRANYDYCIGVA